MTPSLFATGLLNPVEAGGASIESTVYQQTREVKKTTDLSLPELGHEAHHRGPQVGGAGEHLQHVQHLGNAELERPMGTQDSIRNDDDNYSQLFNVIKVCDIWVRVRVYVYEYVSFMNWENGQLKYGSGQSNLSLCVCGGKKKNAFGRRFSVQSFGQI